MSRFAKVRQFNIDYCYLNYENEEDINRRLEHVRALTRVRRRTHAKKKCLCVCGREFIDPSSSLRHEATKIHQQLMAEMG